MLEFELLKIRFEQFRRWMAFTKLGRATHLLGSFMLIYLAIWLITLGFALFVGINPTLVLSVVAAPFWIMIIFVAWRLARIVVGK